ncbi:MAG: EAL domain-containing protein [Pseudomonadales bacterium]|nr:EAL domain-containing protein [Pseudomonadales bacterium]
MLYSIFSIQLALSGLVVDKTDFIADLSPYLEVYEDTSASLSVSEVEKKYQQGLFFRPANDRMSFGLSSSSYWFRFKVEMKTDSDFPLLLNLKNPLLSIVHLFRADDLAGSRFSLVIPLADERTPVFMLKPNMVAADTYYLEVSSLGPIRVPLVLSSVAEYRSQQVTEYLILGLFYGICFGLGVFNLFLYFSTRERSYLSYVLFVAASVGYNMVVDGAGDVSESASRFIIVSLIALQVSAIAQLMRDFFNLPEKEPLLDRLCKYTSIGSLSVIPLAWAFGAGSFVGPVHAFLLPAGLLLLLVSMKRLQAGFKPAIYFLAAWISIVIIAAVLSLDLLGFITLSFSAHAFKVGVLLQLLLFSFALGGRINGLNRTLNAEIIQRIENESALQDSEKRWRTLGEAAFEGVLVFENGLIKETNHSMDEMMGYPTGSAIGTNGYQLLAPDSRDEARDWILSDVPGPIELQLLRGDGSQFFAEVNVRLDRVSGDGAGNIHLVVLRDISDQKIQEDKLRKMAQYDALTNLPNRALFHERLEHAVTAAKRKDKHHAVLFLDLDRFKNVNDSLGHSTGDELLIEVAKRLVSGTRPEDTVARLGGDEFAIMLEDISSLRVVVTVAQKILSLLREPLAIAGHELVTTPSIGIALYPENGNTVEELLRNADTAMYRAKGNGRNCYQFFTQDMDRQMLQRLKLEADLRHALQFRQFILHFQPQICFRTGEVIGAEALVRWDSGLGGIRYPGDFIEVAEETGLIVTLGEQVIDMACEQLAEWKKSGIELPHIAVNLSSKQFGNANMVHSIETILERTGVRPDRLLLEITEAAMMDDETRAIGVMDKLKAMGIQLAIDDFGTGYSSLSYLKNFPIDELKIDRSFISEMVENESDRRIVASIVDLAKHLDLRVIAEGIETLEQAEILSSMRCDNMQGFLFSKPLAADQFFELIQQRKIAHGGVMDG